MALSSSREAVTSSSSALGGVAGSGVAPVGSSSIIYGLLYAAGYPDGSAPARIAVAEAGCGRSLMNIHAGGVLTASSAARGSGNRADAKPHATGPDIAA